MFDKFRKAFKCRGKNIFVNLRKFKPEKYWKKIPESWRPFFLMLLLVLLFLVVSYLLPTKTSTASEKLTKESKFLSDVEKPWDKIEEPWDRIEEYPWQKIKVKVKAEPSYTYLDHLCYEIYKYNLTNSSFAGWTCYPEKFLDYDCMCIAPMED